LGKGKGSGIVIEDKLFRLEILALWSTKTCEGLGSGLGLMMSDERNYEKDKE